MGKNNNKPQNHKLSHKHFFTAGVASFFLTGAILGGFFWSQLASRNRFASALHIYRPGQVIANSYYEVRIDNIARGNGESGSLQPPKDSEYITIDIYIKNKSGKTLEFYPVSQTYIKDSYGQTYSVGPAMVKQPYQVGNIASGDQVKGEIAYQVPKNIKNPLFYIEGLASKPVVVKLN